ncbi:hypothetical protein H310_05703 [Aphanomyces invadans]|uniref:Uncharacterized protein n=1 Tax=Aphanomyces invadans TaxID=157072 RepID=A0A024U7A1_9STRA|nr:hypothetical protein H310_05703 [Aphanomyces invadans]ETW02100.1 hypothetical protein H310_05703 [Aphanomyces invadans]|eukprot:XP_008868705.1 hypothetical protein H310_05703 [Aphanomyces invadans]
MTRCVTRSMRKTRSFSHPTALAATYFAATQKVPRVAATSPRQARTCRIIKEKSATAMPSTPVTSLHVPFWWATPPPTSTVAYVSMSPCDVNPSLTVDDNSSSDELLSTALWLEFDLVPATVRPNLATTLRSAQDNAFVKVAALKSTHGTGHFVFCRRWGHSNRTGSYESEGPYSVDRVIRALEAQEYSAFRSELAQSRDNAQPATRCCGIFVFRDGGALLVLV